jgi:ParB-like chromosome segregation protein Spo0J
VVVLVSEVVPAAAQSVQLVELTDIRSAAEAWPRRELDADRVHEFCSLYQVNGEGALPPIEVIADPMGGFVLADGWHRLTGLRAVGAARVQAVVVPIPAGTDPAAAAFLYAVARSAISAKPLTRAEKQAAVLRLIDSAQTPRIASCTA